MGTIASLFWNWRARWQARAAKRALVLLEFADFVEQTKPLAPKAPKYPDAALFRHVWRRAAALSLVARNADQQDSADRFVEFAKLASRQYDSVAPRNMYGKVRLKLDQRTLSRVIEQELARESAEEEMQSLERSGRFKGIVYMLESGGNYKIGMTTNLGRRITEIGTLMPDPLVVAHQIHTNRPEAIEAHWHRRFASKRKKGEWFALTEADIAEFQQYSTM